MSSSYLSAARDLVVTGMRESQVDLSPDLEFHLASTVAFYMRRPVRTDSLTNRMMKLPRKRGREEYRRIGNDCLISCAFFVERLTRNGGSIVYYAGLGQAAYDVAGMTEAALGFPDMLDVLQGSLNNQKNGPVEADGGGLIHNLLNPSMLRKHPHC